MNLRDMTAEVRAVNEENGWVGGNAPTATFGELVALLHSEVSEALEAYREHGLADMTVGRKPEGVGPELADVLIRLLDTADRIGIDLKNEYDRKITFNRTRSYRHGNKNL